jgi:hypothetical protein
MLRSKRMQIGRAVGSGDGEHRPIDEALVLK